MLTPHILVISHRRKCMTKKQNTKKATTPPQKIHLSCLALLSTIRIVSPLTPRVFATLYNLLWVPLRISRCWPKSPSTARPRSRNSSNWALAVTKKFCSRSACSSRVKFSGPAPKERPSWALRCAGANALWVDVCA